MITICAAFVSTFLGVETVHSERRQKSKDHLLQFVNNTNFNVSEITFTTLQPEIQSEKLFKHEIYSNIPNVHKVASQTRDASKKILRIHSTHSIQPRLYPLNRYKVNRRRRQLQHSATKTKSYDIKENYAENQQFETIQGPAAAFEDGSIRIEPIYRVSKSKNIFDSIVDVIHKIINPSKALGPFVGPFHFPGVGDKVYVRLLEPLNSKHLVIRLISHSPVTEIQSTFEKNVLPSSELIEHPEISSIDHDPTLSLPNSEVLKSYGQHNDAIHLASSDSLPSSSNVEQVKLTNNFGPKSKVNSAGKHNLRTYKLSFKHGNVNGIQKIKHHKRNPSITKNNNNINHISRLKQAGEINRTKDNLRSDSYQELANDSSGEDDSKLLTVDFQQIQHPVNASLFEQISYNTPIPSFESFPSDQIFSNPRIQASSINRQVQSYNVSNESTTPKYSIKFASKNMRYLNLDGSVEPAIKKNSDGGEFKSTEMDPVVSKVPKPVDSHWRVLRGVNPRSKEAIVSANKQSQHGGSRERGDRSDDAFFRGVPEV